MSRQSQRAGVNCGQYGAGTALLSARLTPSGNDQAFDSRTTPTWTAACGGAGRARSRTLILATLETFELSWTVCVASAAADVAACLRTVSRPASMRTCRGSWRPDTHTVSYAQNRMWNGDISPLISTPLHRRTPAIYREKTDTGNRGLSDPW